jgi:hypothetical protein
MRCSQELKSMADTDCGIVCFICLGCLSKCTTPMVHSDRDTFLGHQVIVKVISTAAIPHCMDTPPDPPAVHLLLCPLPHMNHLQHHHTLVRDRWPPAVLRGRGQRRWFKQTISLLLTDLATSSLSAVQ